MVSSESTAQKKKIIKCSVWCSNRVPLVRCLHSQSIKPLPHFWRGGLLTVFKDMVMLLSYGGYTERVIKDLLGDRRNEPKKVSWNFDFIAYSYGKNHTLSPGHRGAHLIFKFQRVVACFLRCYKRSIFINILASLQFGTVQTFHIVLALFITSNSHSNYMISAFF